jgi:hypothetical protein
MITPTSPTFATPWPLATNNHGLMLLDMGKPTAAEAEYRAALAIQRKLADEHPTVAHFSRNGNPIYAWSFEDRRVWNPERTTSSVRLLRRVVPVSSRQCRPS